MLNYFIWSFAFGCTYKDFRVFSKGFGMFLSAVSDNSELLGGTGLYDNDYSSD